MLALMTILMLVLSACSGGKLSSSTESSKSDGEDGIIKLGLSIPLSGSVANVGITLDWVAQQAVKRINEQGGVTVDGKAYKFKVISYDNKYEAAAGTEVHKR
jgi:ABC-type branched-subunit amino acid transport system substrate-binding protein